MNLLTISVIVSALIGVSLAAPKYQPFAFEDDSNVIAGFMGFRNNNTHAMYLYTLFTCYVNTIDNVSVEHNLESEWSGPRKAITPHLDELRECTKDECAAQESMTILFIVGSFIDEISEEHEDAEAAISQGWIGTCNAISAPTNHESALDRLNDIHSEITPTECAAKWQCAIRVATNGTEVFNFTELWTVPKSEIEHHVLNILNFCPIAASIPDCCEDESNHASAVFYKFVNSFPITMTGMKASSTILDAFLKQCAHDSDGLPRYGAGPRTVLNRFDDEFRDAAGRLQCMADTVVKVIFEFNLAGDWELMNQQLQLHMNELQNCTSLWCSITKSLKVTTILMEYLRKAHVIIPVAYEEMVRRIQDRCNV